MAATMENTRTLPSGRVIYRRVYPAALRPFVPKQAREFKVSLGLQGDPETSAMHAKAARQYEAVVAKARAQLSGVRSSLTAADAQYLADRFVVERLEEDEEGRWDQEGRDLYEAVGKQLESLGIANSSPWRERRNLRWSEKTRELVTENLRAHRMLKATGDLNGIVDAWREEAVELARENGFDMPSDDGKALRILCRAINDAAIRSDESRLLRLEGDDVPTPPMPQRPATATIEGPAAPPLSILAIYDGYASAQGISEGVRKEWRRAIERLVAFLGHDDPTRLKATNLRDWRDALLLEETAKGTLRTPRTVRNKYLTPLKAALTWAVDEQKIEKNVAADVVVRVPKAAKLREKSFTSEEAAKVLKAALVPSAARTSPKSALARRWVPWLCAYTGARVNEITQLRREDILKQDGVWLIRITPEAGRVKTNEARLVPVHAHLIEQGFLQVVEGALPGPLFYDETRRRVDEGVESRQHKKIGERLAAWVRNDVGIVDPAIKPNHAWRDTFKTLALEAGIQERVFDAMQGHAPTTVGQTYGHASVKTLSAAMDRFPRFVVD